MTNRLKYHFHQYFNQLIFFAHYFVLHSWLCLVNLVVLIAERSGFILPRIRRLQKKCFEISFAGFDALIPLLGGARGGLETFLPTPSPSKEGNNEPEQVEISDSSKFLFLKNSYTVIVSLLFCFSLLPTQAQTDTLLTLPTIEVTETILESKLIGHKTETFDSLRLMESGSPNVAELLSNESNVFVKSYGMGSLATSSIRGGAGGHTAVLWNNFSIQSPMLGLLDLSMLPSVFVENVGLSYGGSSALWGSGAIGGVISLENKSQFQKEQSVLLRSDWGSFGHWQEQIKFTFGNGKWYTTTRAFYQQAQNDFTYEIREDLPLKTQTNADIQQGGFLQSIGYKISNKQSVNAHFWWQKGERGIPPNTTQTRSNARQEDEVYRGSLDWRYIGQELTLKARTALFKEDNFFENPERLTENLNTFWTNINEIEGDWYLNKNSQIHLGSNHTFTKAKTGNYTTAIEQNRFALLAALHQKVKQWQFSLNARQEWIEGQGSVFVPALGVEGKLFSNIELKAQVSRNYRLPTLNDLYWNPGGNPDLLPEVGWSEEIGLSYQKKLGKKNRFNYGITVFNRNIDNWILWAPKAGEFWYSAQNIAKVWSRGIEQKIKYNYIANNFELQIIGGYDYILSTNEADENSLFEKGEQIVYTPIHQFFGQLNIGFKGFRGTYSHHYKGKTTTINEPLEAYHIGTFRLSQKIGKNKFKAQCFTEINNVWNAQYRVIERRAMPGRNFQIGLVLSVKK